jgi:hypothetical protein
MRLPTIAKPIAGRTMLAPMRQRKWRIVAMMLAEALEDVSHHDMSSVCHRCRGFGLGRHEEDCPIGEALGAFDKLMGYDVLGQDAEEDGN